MVNAYLECYEHTSDILEQQRLIQAIVDEMAKRPRLNLSATHFRDSYLAEIECLKAKTQLIREVMCLLIEDERQANNGIREYIEQAYRLLYSQLKKDWSYAKPEDRERALNEAELQKTSIAGHRDIKNDKLLNNMPQKSELNKHEVK